MTVAWKTTDQRGIYFGGGEGGGSENNAGPAKGEGPPAHPTLGTFCGTPPPPFILRDPQKVRAPGPRKRQPPGPRKSTPRTIYLSRIRHTPICGPPFCGIPQKAPPPLGTHFAGPRKRHPRDPQKAPPAKGPRDPAKGTPRARDPAKGPHNLPLQNSAPPTPPASRSLVAVLARGWERESGCLGWEIVLLKIGGGIIDYK